MRRAILSSVCVIALGCSFEGDGERAAVFDGLTVLEAGEGALSLAFRAGDDVIYMEALRGRATPEHYREVPDMPAWEVDARFLSDAGGTFYSRRGGDGWVNRQWARDLDAQSDARPSATSNEHLFRLASDAAAVMRDEIVRQIGAERAAALAPEIDAIHGFAARALEAFEASLAHRREQLAERGAIPSIEGPTGDVTYGTNGPENEDRQLGGNYYYIAMHSESLSGVAGWFGDHSATQLHEWLGAWYHVHDACNHGRCASQMRRTCLLQYYEAVDVFKPAWRFQNCKTHYDWNSGGGAHNCHDDSRLQMNNFVYGSILDTQSAWCKDTNTNLWQAPNCDQHTARGYHHPSHCDYSWNQSCPLSWRGTQDGCDCGCVWPASVTGLPGNVGSDPDCR